MHYVTIKKNQGTVFFPSYSFAKLYPPTEPSVSSFYRGVVENSCGSAYMVMALWTNVEEKVEVIIKTWSKIDVCPKEYLIQIFRNTNGLPHLE